MTTERTVFAQSALDFYISQPMAPDYDDFSMEELHVIAETDAFIAGWEASVDHFHQVVKGMDIPGPLKAIIGDLLDANRAEHPVKE